MVLTRIQGSDFQAGSKKANLSRLEALARLAPGASAVDIVGDVFDTHILPEIVSSSPDTNLNSLVKSSPKAKGLTQKRDTLYEALSKKYGGKINPNSLAPEEIESIKKLDGELRESGVTDAETKDFVYSIGGYYGDCAKILGGIKAPKYYIRGNNDTGFMDKIVKGIYPELEGKLIEDGPFRIIGMNNTNYPQEDKFTQIKIGAIHVPPDWSGAYEKYCLKKAGKKANIIMMHGPPNGFRDGHDEKDGEGIVRLINEHVPDKGFMLVECGHFHNAMLEAVESKDGGGIVVARSSPDIVFKHIFGADGYYRSTEIYQYKN